MPPVSNFHCYFTWASAYVSGKALVPMIKLLHMCRDPLIMHKILPIMLAALLKNSAIMLKLWSLISNSFLIFILNSHVYCTFYR